MATYKYKPLSEWIKKINVASQCVVKRWNIHNIHKKEIISVWDFNGNVEFKQNGSIVEPFGSWYINDNDERLIDTKQIALTKKL